MGLSLEKPPKLNDQIEFERWLEKFWTNLFRLTSYCYFDTASGHGSTNTKIRNFTNIVYSDNDIEGSVSATLGAKALIKTAGLYIATVCDGSAAASENVGISKWSESDTPTLTTNIQSIAKANRVAFTGTVAGIATACSTCVMRLVPGDVLYHHTDGDPDLTTVTTTFKVGRLI